MKSLILVHGDKGGVGKSFCAKVILDVLLDMDKEQAQNIGLLDCDSRNPDVAYMYEDKVETGRFDLTATEGWVKMVDWIENCEQQIIIVSLPAQVGKTADEFGGIFAESMDALDVSLNVVWMLDSGRDSVNLFENCLDQNWPVKRWFVVKNNFLGREFDVWNESSARKKYLEMNQPELELPVLDIAIRDRLVANRQTFVEGYVQEGRGINHFDRIRLQKTFSKMKLSLKPIFEAIAQDFM